MTIVPLRFTPRTGAEERESAPSALAVLRCGSGRGAACWLLCLCSARDVALWGVLARPLDPRLRRSVRLYQTLVTARDSSDAFTTTDGRGYVFVRACVCA